MTHNCFFVLVDRNQINIYLFSMSNNEELSSKGEQTNTTTSFTDCLSIGPIAVASRFVSALSRQPRNSIPKESNNTNGKSTTITTTTSSPIFNPTRNRSISPKSPSSEPSLSTTTNPFSRNSPSTMRNSSTTPSGLNHISKLSVTPTTPTPETVDLNFNFTLTYTQLRDLAEINCNYFSQQKNDVCRRFERLLIQLCHSMELTVPMIRYLTENFHHFDYSPEVNLREFLSSFVFFFLLLKIRANGYRTLVVTHGQACLRTLNILQQVDTKRVGLLFNLMYSSGLFQDLESWTKALIGMQHLLSFAVKLVDYSKKETLYVNE